jgi:hypothetical protein
MGVIEVQSRNGHQIIEFLDQYDDKCIISVTKLKTLIFTVTDEDSQSCAIFSQQDIKSILPYLQSFAENGTLDLQGENDQLQDGIAQ